MSKLALTSPGTSVTIPTLTIPTTTDLTPITVAQWALNWLLWAAGVVAIGFLIYGGILFVTSGGDAEKATKARNMLLYSIVGVIVVGLAYALVMWANTVIK